jgi:glycerol-3-phosphate dehydrogenase (NAD(P)+)
MENILFIGGGSWGSALSFSLAKKGISSTIWHRDPEIVSLMKESRVHYLIPSLRLPSNIYFSNQIKAAIQRADIVVFAIPSQSIRRLIVRNKKYFTESKIIINASKGIENNSLMTVSQVIRDVLGSNYKKIVTLSGPSHAEEVIRLNPTTLVSSSNDEVSAKKVQFIFSSDFLRIYINKDILGVELGGAIKNVIAIASGICDGIGYGDNTKAALLTRGISEITNLGVLMGANSSTFQGLSGIGDLIVTALSMHSRNRMVGQEIGKGKLLSAVLKKMEMVAEGVQSSISVNELRKYHKADMPICESVYNILFNKKDPKKTVYELMNRELKIEN